MLPTIRPTRLAKIHAAFFHMKYFTFSPLDIVDIIWTLHTVPAPISAQI
jgi:hypothetical protein